MLLGLIWASNSCKLFRLFLDKTQLTAHGLALAEWYHLIDDHVLFMSMVLRVLFPERVPNCKFFRHHLNIPSTALETPEQTPETHDALASFASGD